MKSFIWTFLFVAVGVYLYGKLTKAGTSPGGILTLGPLSIKPAESNIYQGPDVDPQTGGYLPPGAQPGTVSFPVQSVP